MSPTPRDSNAQHRDNFTEAAQSLAVHLRDAARLASHAAAVSASDTPAPRLPDLAASIITTLGSIAFIQNIATISASAALYIPDEQD